MPRDLFASVGAAFRRAMGEPVTVQTTAGPVVLLGVWSTSHYVAPVEGSPIPVSLVQASLQVREADATDVAVGDTLVRGGRTWRVHDLRPDGYGELELLLEQVDA